MREGRLKGKNSINEKKRAIVTRYIRLIQIFVGLKPVYRALELIYLGKNIFIRLMVAMNIVFSPKSGLY